MLPCLSSSCPCPSYVASHDRFFQPGPPSISLAPLEFRLCCRRGAQPPATVSGRVCTEKSDATPAARGCPVSPSQGLVLPSLSVDLSPLGQRDCGLSPRPPTDGAFVQRATWPHSYPFQLQDQPPGTSVWLGALSSVSAFCRFPSALTAVISEEGRATTLPLCRYLEESQREALILVGQVLSHPFFFPTCP